MPSDTSETNPALFSQIYQNFSQYLLKHPEATISEILSNYRGNPDAAESEIVASIYWAAKKEFIILESRKPSYNSTIKLLKKSDESIDNDIFRIVVTIPKNVELGLSRVVSRNQMVETRQAFREIFNKAQNKIRITSPFFEKSVLLDEGLPDIPDYFRFAFERGCEISIITREFSSKKKSNLQWVRDIANEMNCNDALKIFNYHYEETNRIISSVHSKLLIADAKLAYFGSAEIRKNSLYNNFEVGCLVGGSYVAGLVEAFDLMQLYSTEVM